MNFEGRLSLQNGETTYKAATAYSTTHIKTWLAHSKNIWILECENLPDKNFLGDNSIATVSLERLGSRAFAGWYSGYFPANTAVGIGKTLSFITDRDMIIEEKGEGLHFAVACRVIKESVSPIIINTHRTEQKTDKNKFTILVSVVTERESAQPANAAKRLLDEAEGTGIDQLKKGKDSWYRNFWSNSFIKLGNDAPK